MCSRFQEQRNGQRVEDMHRVREDAVEIEDAFGANTANLRIEDAIGGRRRPAIWPILNCTGFQIRDSELCPDPNCKRLNFEPRTPKTQFPSVFERLSVTLLSFDL